MKLINKILCFMWGCLLKPHTLVIRYKHQYLFADRHRCKTLRESEAVTYEQIFGRGK